MDNVAQTAEITLKDEACDFCGKHTLIETMQWDRFPHGAGGTDIIDHVVLKACVPVVSCKSCGEVWTDYRGEELRDAVSAGYLETASAARQMRVAVKPLDENKTAGWTDDKGRFCLPLSAGYYIKFPIKDDPTQLFMTWYYNNPIGGSSDYKETKRLAQEHNKRRVLEEVELLAAPQQDAAVADPASTIAQQRTVMARIEPLLSDDWTVSDTETAGAILDYLGYGQDASKEPGADQRRDKIARIIRARIEARCQAENLEEQV